MSFRPANIYVLWTSLVSSLFMYLCMYAISLLPCAIVYFVLTMYCCNLTRLKLGMLPVCFTCALPSIYITDSALAVYTIGTGYC